MLSRNHRFAAFTVFFLGVFGWLFAVPPGIRAQVPGDYVLLVVNDLGMHCMNKDHHNLSILPPFNTLNAQVIRKGDASRLPQVITVLQGGSLDYSIPGNTYSVGKTDFWSYDVQLFGVDLPDNVGLTGNGMTGSFTSSGDMFIAEGIPLTPFPDATPTVENPYQTALIQLKDAMGTVLATSTPVMPVSTEVNCVTSGCHSSELAILYSHEREGGFNPDNRPILCASCHNSVVLTGNTGPGSQGYFSRVIHSQHSFIDQLTPGLAACQHCHPGPQTKCLRGTMATDHQMICQDCHGTMANVAGTISNGRIPWVDEPACRTCHTSQYGEPVGVRYRDARGHGGVMCTGCHNSPHAIFPSREAADNKVMVDLQGHQGTLEDCTVCHGITPAGDGPHGFRPVSAVETEIIGNAGALKIFPAPFRSGGKCTIMAENARGGGDGRLLIFDVRGRTVRMVQAAASSEGRVRLFWDGRDGNGQEVASGVYFMRYNEGPYHAAGKLVVIN